MLVISRKVGESLILSDHIKITITSLSNDKVTIGIEAPREVKVFREELLETIEANKASNEKLARTDYQEIAALIKNKNNNK